MPSDVPATGEATFYLDELEVGTEHSRWGFHDPERSRLPRFLLWGCALILLLGLIVGMGLEGLAFLKENYWALLLWAGIAFLVYRFKFRQRPYFRIEGSGLAFRSKAHRAERRVAWSDLERIELEPAAVVLRRAGNAPVHLYFPNLSRQRVQALKDTLSEAARRHSVTVA